VPVGGCGDDGGYRPSGVVVLPLSTFWCGLEIKLPLKQPVKPILVKPPPPTNHERTQKQKEAAIGKKVEKDSVLSPQLRGMEGKGRFDSTLWSLLVVVVLLQCYR